MVGSDREQQSQEDRALLRGSASVQDLQPGSLDEALPRILPMVEAQLFGGVAEEKEAGAFAGTREAKKLRAYDTFQMLAQGVTFRTQLATLLAPVGLLPPAAASSNHLHVQSLIPCVPGPLQIIPHPSGRKGEQLMRA